MTAVPLTRRWATGLSVLRRIAFALRVADPPLFGKTCLQAGLGESGVDCGCRPVVSPGRALGVSLCPSAFAPDARPVPNPINIFGRAAW